MRRITRREALTGAWAYLRVEAAFKSFGFS